jgi:hypothetical protein
MRAARAARMTRSIFAMENTSLESIRVKTHVLKFVATSDVSRYVDVPLKGATSGYHYRILTFDGKRGTIAQCAMDWEADSSILSLPICLVDYA